ncbi:hypothetical protein [Nonomuraea sp. NPDC002799]
MLEPEPTPADQWSRWDAKPTIPSYWPGLGYEHQSEGFEIDRNGVRIVSGQLVKMARPVLDYGSPWPGSKSPLGIQWALPRELDVLLSRASTQATNFWVDLHAEVGMAGLLISRVATNYQLGDDPRLGDLPIDQLDQRLVDMMPGDAPSHVFTATSDLYPNGTDTFQLPAGIDYGVGHMSAEMAMQDIAQFPYFGGYPEDQGWLKQMADSVVEVTHTLLLRAQDLRDAPWRGAAADVAQSALRQIYANATALAATVGSLDAATFRFQQIADWCYKNFDKAADPNRSDWDDYWDGGDTADGRAQKFLEQANQKFFEVRDMMPKQIKEDLPGLMVTDELVNELRESAQNVATRPKDSEFLKENDAAWQKHWLPILQGAELAEEKYG